MKRILKRSISVFLAITIIFSSAYVGLNKLDFSGLFAIEANAVSGGTLNSKISWEINENGILTISGTGYMPDYTSSLLSPFSGITNIKEVVITDGITRIGEHTFSACTNLESVSIPSSVKSIGTRAFSDCTSLTFVTIPEGVISLGCEVFHNCTNLKKVTIPISVTGLNSCEFIGCTNLTSIDVDSNNEYYCSENGILFDKQKTKIMCYPAAKTQKAYVIPESVTNIAFYAFYNCANLESITIASSVMSIGASAFNMCTSLKSIVIPKGVTEIGSFTFYKCKNLESVTIPDSVKSIGMFAFEDCEKLHSIIIPDSVTSIGDSAFQNCKAIEAISIGEEVTSIGGGAFINCINLSKFEINENNTTYSSADGVLFNKDKSVLIQYPANKTKTEYTIPDSVTNINNYAFAGCKNLTSIIIPNSVKIIDAATFQNCSVLSEVKIGNSVTSIGYSAFSNCKSLTAITIPDSVTDIDDNAFRECDSLTTVTIGNGVENIGYSAFLFCTSLESVYITDLTSWCNINFEVSYSNPLYYAQNLYVNGELVTDIVIPQGVTSICDWAFTNCTSFKSVVIPDSVENIGNYSFRNCTNIVKITIPNSVTNVGTDAFVYCDKLKGITIPDSVKSIGENAIKSPTKIYCYENSVAHNYAVNNSCSYTLINIHSINNQVAVDYDNNLIFSSVDFYTDISNMVSTCPEFVLDTYESFSAGNTKLYGTGAKVNISNNSTVLDEYTVITVGDLNGDSVCDVIDASTAQLYASGFHEPTQNEVYAANGCISDEIDETSYQNVVNVCLAS